MPVDVSNADKYSSYKFFGSDDDLKNRCQFPTTEVAGRANELAVVFTYVGRLNSDNLDYNTKFLINRPAVGGGAGATVTGVIHVHFYRQSRRVAVVRWKAHDGDNNNTVNICQHKHESTWADLEGRRNMALNLGTLRGETFKLGVFPLHVSLFRKLMDALSAIPSNTTELPDVGP
jgi:hypothetical protein